MNSKKSIYVVGSVLLLLCLTVASYAQGRRDYDRGRNQGQLVQLGRSYVDGRNDHDRITVSNGESYRSLLLEVKGGTIEFQRVVVHFDNGADHDIQIRDRISNGGRTREIDLPGDRRRIRSVEFWYSKGNWRSRPYVNLWGRTGFGNNSDGRDDSDHDRRGDEAGFENIGQVYVDSRNDHDRIMVTNRGTFRGLQLGVKGGAIEFQRVLVHFENGGDADLPVRERIQDRGKTRVMDLPGDRRKIRSIEFWYSKENWRSRPMVNIWGAR